MHFGIQIALVAAVTIGGAVIAATLDYVKAPAKTEEKKEDVVKDEDPAKEV